MRHARRKIDWFLILSVLFLIRCATDPGTSTPVAGAGIVFTQATGQVRVVSSVEGTVLKSAAVLFDTNTATGALGEATSIEEGVAVTWPDALSFELPGCSVRPTLIESTSHLTYKIFIYAYPDTCTPVASSEVAAQATIIITKNGTSATIADTTSPVGEQTFTASGSWTAPSGVTSVTVECWGGGGGGEGDAGPGGGGGAYSKKTSISVTPGVTYTANVGSGGTGGSGSLFPYVGGAGADSWFSTVGTVLAKGGGAANGSGGLGGSSLAGVGSTLYSGGNGSNQFFGAGGGGGSSAGTTSNGVDAALSSGAAAPSGGGRGGGGGSGNPIPSSGGNGTSPGGGGGGGGTGDGTGRGGGAGGAGKVIVSWD